MLKPQNKFLSTSNEQNQLSLRLHSIEQEILETDGFSQSKFRALFDYSLDFIATLQPDGKLIEANQTFLDFGGLTLVDVAGKYLWEQWWEIQAQVQLKTAIVEAARGEIIRYEVELSGSKSVINIDLSIIPVWNKNKEVVLLLVQGRDITEKKQLKAQLLRLQCQECVGMLALSMAHDLNNILTPILIATELLKKSFPDAEMKNQKLLDILQTNVKYGTKLVKQVLSFSRGIPEKQKQLQIESLILEVKDFAQRMFSKSIKICTYIQSDLHPISGDVTQLYQLLINLCINARDAMPKGGTLDISVENIFINENYAWMSNDAKIGDYIKITVSDTGIGIKPEIVDQIFEPFFTTKDIENGTGLGLSTVKTIVKNHDGFINLFSKVGEGTVFKVYLPALQQQFE